MVSPFSWFSPHLLLSVQSPTFCQRLDKKAHPNTLLSLGHGQHDVTWFAINLSFLILRRKRNFKILEERQNYNLHLKNSADNVNR